MVFTFGEIMLRISPADIAERIIQAVNYEIRPGGSESNVAIALANLGIESGFISALPNDVLGKKILKHLKSEGINTNYISFSNSRLGLYWTENGTGPRNSYVIYDRDNSAFSQITYLDFPWNEILTRTTWFHFSGICPAVSKKVYILLEELITKISIPYSVDLNFRKNLWGWVDRDKLVIKKIMTKLCSKAILLTGNESDFQEIFNISSKSQDDSESFSDIARQCFDLFPQLQYISISNRKSVSANNNDWTGFLFVKDNTEFSFQGITYKIDNIQDRVGTGDSFTAAIIYGLRRKSSMSYQNIIDFAVTLSALNHTTKGDSSNFSSEEVWSVMQTQGNGRIIR